MRNRLTIFTSLSILCGCTIDVSVPPISVELPFPSQVSQITDASVKAFDAMIAEKSDLVDAAQPIDADVSMKIDSGIADAGVVDTDTQSKGYLASQCSVTARNEQGDSIVDTCADVSGQDAWCAEFPALGNMDSRCVFACDTPSECGYITTPYLNALCSGLGGHCVYRPYNIRFVRSYCVSQ